MAQVVDRETARVTAKSRSMKLMLFCGALALQIGGLVDAGKLPEATWLLLALAVMKAIAMMGGGDFLYLDKTIANNTKAVEDVVGGAQDTVATARGVAQEFANGVTEALRLNPDAGGESVAR